MKFKGLELFSKGIGSENKEPEEEFKCPEMLVKILRKCVFEVICELQKKYWEKLKR